MYKFAFRNLWVKKSRTALAMVGLIIAIIGIVSLVSISAGIRFEITKVLSQMEGVSVINKNAYDDSVSMLSLDYVEKMKEFPESKIVLPVVTGVASGFEGRTGFTADVMGGMVALIGLDPSEALRTEKGSFYNPELVAGRFLKKGEKSSCMIGKAVADDFKKTVGNKVTFNGRDFKVVGIYDTGSRLMDRSVAVDLEVAQELTGRDESTIGMIYIEPKNPKDSERLASKINFKYDDELKASSGTGFASQISGLLSSLDAFFIGISSIALIVGAVGILNTMLMSVKERTREFGILKAVGWTGDDVVKLVLYESFFLGVIGGAVGVVAAFVAVQIADPLLPFHMYVTWDLVAYAFAVSVVLGVFGGVYPAWRAAKLDPIEAIRYE
ncbi:MAG: FtsX-like permease family protein [archaeon]